MFHNHYNTTPWFSVDMGEDLLRRNYDALLPDEAQLCKDEIVGRLDFVREGQLPPASLDGLVEIKRVAKVARHLLGCDPDTFDGLTSILYHLEVYGISIAKQLQDDGDDHLRITRTAAHLQNEACNVAMILSRNDRAWLELAYRHVMQSAYATIDSEHDYAAHRFLRAAGIAALQGSLANQYENSKRAFETADDPDVMRSAILDEIKAAESGFKQSESLKWAARLYDSVQTAIAQGYLPAEEQQERLLAVSRRAHELTGQTSWAEAWYDCAKMLTQQPTFDRYLELAEASLALHNSTNSVRHLERRYKHLLSAINTGGVPYARLCETMQTAINTAWAISLRHHKKRWQKKADSCFRKLAEQSDSAQR